MQIRGHFCFSFLHLQEIGLVMCPFIFGEACEKRLFHLLIICCRYGDLTMFSFWDTFYLLAYLWNLRLLLTLFDYLKYLEWFCYMYIPQSWALTAEFESLFPLFRGSRRKDRKWLEEIVCFCLVFSGRENCKNNLHFIIRHWLAFALNGFLGVVFASEPFYRGFSMCSEI